MNRLPEEFLFCLLEKNKIAEEFRLAHIRLSECEKGFSCSCPFHAEAGKSCRIYPETHNFYCPVCRIGGDVITFLMLTQNFSYEEAVRVLAERHSLKLPDRGELSAQTLEKRSLCYAINRETANFYYQNLLHGSDRRGLAYFQQRKLHPRMIQKYGLGYAPDNWHQLYHYLTQKGYSEEDLLLANVCRRSEKGNIYDNFRNRVIFPIVDMRHRVIGFGGRVLDDSKPKYLNTSDTPVFDKGRNLFSLYFAGQNAPSSLILAEGYMDVIALHQAGFENAVATLGTAITPQQAQLIAQYADEVIISYDSDAAGQNATQKAIRHFQDVGLSARILHIDEDAKDPDEYIKKFGAERFRQLLHQAGNATEFQLDRCRNGLNLQTENGKVTYLRRSVQVLSGIGNTKAREFYVRKKAEELSIRPEVLLQQVKKYAAGRDKKERRHFFQTEVETSFRRQDAVTPEAQNHLKESESEKLILGALMRFPEQYQDLFSRLLPDDFITEFHRRIYEMLCQVLPSCTRFIPSLLGSALSPEEMFRITGIFINFRDKINPRAVQDCVENLLAEKNKTIDKTNLSDDDLLQVIANKKKITRFT